MLPGFLWKKSYLVQNFQSFLALTQITRHIKEEKLSASISEGTPIHTKKSQK